MMEAYKTIPQVDLALRRASLRRRSYRDLGMDLSARTQTAVIDRLLDRRLELMRGRS